MPVFRDYSFAEAYEEYSTELSGFEVLFDTKKKKKKLYDLWYFCLYLYGFDDGLIQVTFHS